MDEATEEKKLKQSRDVWNKLFSKKCIRCGELSIPYPHQKDLGEGCCIDCITHVYRYLRKVQGQTVFYIQLKAWKRRPLFCEKCGSPCFEGEYWAGLCRACKIEESRREDMGEESTC